jgi:hypothetical protein
MYFASLPSELSDGFYSYSVFVSLSDEYGHLGSKTRGTSNESQKIKLPFFSKTALTSVVQFQRFAKTIALNKTIGVISSEK